jgi:hypothetical protein
MPIDGPGCGKPSEELRVAVIFFRSDDASPALRDLQRISVYPAIQRAAFVLVALLGAGFLRLEQAYGQLQQPDNRRNIIHGTVVNSVTHAPIGRALVSSLDDRYAMLTDGEGRFEFTLPEAGNQSEGSFGFEGQSRPISGIIASSPFWFRARKPGFLDDPNERAQLPASPGSELTISLMPEALIVGRVILSAADAATGINVEIFSRLVQEGIPRWMPGGTVRANSDGQFRFAELQPGAYKLVTNELMDNDPAVTVPGGQQYGFPPVYYPSATDFAAASTIQLTAGQTVQADISLVRQPYYAVRIPVTNTEEGSHGMQVTVSARGHRGPGYSLGYNAGRQRIEGLLPAGNYLVEAEAFGLNPATGAVNIAVAGAPVEVQGMVLTRTSSITLNVKEEFASDRNGSGSWSTRNRTFPLHGPRLYLRVSAEAAEDFELHGGGSLRQPTGPNDDVLVLEGLPPGRYWLRLSSSRGYVAAATLGTVDLLHQPLVVASGSTTPIEITMRDDSAHIEGTVASTAAQTAPTESSGSTPAWVYCIPLPDGPGQFEQLSTSPDGGFNSPMTPGTYRVLAFKNRQPNLPYRDAEAMRAYDAKGQAIHLSPGQKETVQLQIVSPSE